jgi:hypothetical protein
MRRIALYNLPRRSPSSTEKWSREDSRKSGAWGEPAPDTCTEQEAKHKHRCRKTYKHGHRHKLARKTHLPLGLQQRHGQRLPLSCCLVGVRLCPRQGLCEVISLLRGGVVLGCPLRDDRLVFCTQSHDMRRVPLCNALSTSGNGGGRERKGGGKTEGKGQALSGVQKAKG